MPTTQLNIKILLEQAKKFMDNNPEINEVELTDSLGYKVHLIRVDRRKNVVYAAGILERC